MRVRSIEVLLLVVVAVGLAGCQARQVPGPEAMPDQGVAAVDLGGPDDGGTEPADLGGAEASRPAGHIAFDATRAYEAELSGDTALIDVTGDGHLDVVGPDQWEQTVAVLPGDGRGGFGGPVPSDVGVSQPELFAVADLDGDGHPDEIVAGRGALGSVEWRKNDGYGAFGASSVLAVGSSTPSALWAMDVTGDGKADIIVADDASVSVFVAQGGSAFATAARTTPRPASTSAPQLADFNGDGKIDVAWVADNAGDFSVLLCPGSGDGHFGACLSTRGGNLPLGGAAAVVRLDSDARADLAVMLDKGLALFRGSSAGGFAAAGTVLADRAVTSVVSGDFDGDGSPDLAAGLDSFAITILRNDGGSGWKRLRTYDAAGSRLQVGDLDSDGKLDLVSIDSFGIDALLGRGDGTFRAAETAEVDDFSSALITADLDGDGRLDVLTVGAAAGAGAALHVQLQKTPGTFVELARDAWAGGGLTGVRAADVNHDGKLDLVAFSGGPSPGPVVRQGNGDGTFQAARALAPEHAALGDADFDGDGIADPVRPAKMGLEIHRSTHEGWISVGGGLTRVTTFAAADVDGDGHVDLVAVDNQEHSADVVLLRGRGDGSFWPELRTAAADAPRQLALADVDGDGDRDLVAVGASALALWRAQGAQAFAAPMVIATAGQDYSRDFLLADFDRDGRIDLVYVSSTGCAVYGGDGMGGFSPAQLFVTGPPTLLSAADLDGDGRLDLVASGLGRTWHAHNASP